MSHHDADPSIVNAETKPELGYEVRDIDAYFGKLMKSTFHFMAWTTVIILLCIPIYTFLTARNFKLPMEAVRSAESDPQFPADTPVLQSGDAAMADIHSLRKQEWLKANSYGWVDKQKGIVKIPIEEAMKRAANDRSLIDGGATPN